MKTIIRKYNLNYSELKQILIRYNVYKVFITTILIIGVTLAFFISQKATLITLPIFIVLMFACKTVNNVISRMTVDFDLTEIVDDIETDWR